MRLTNQAGYNLKDQAYFSKFYNKTYPGFKKNSAACWNLEGNFLATGDNSLKIWAFNENYGLELLGESRGSESVTELKFYHNNLVATVNKDTLRLWDIRQSAKPFKSQKKSKPELLTLSWNHNLAAPHLALLSKDNTISIYDIRSLNTLNQPLHSEKCKNDITEIEWDQSGSVLFCAGGDSGSGVLMMYNQKLELIGDLGCLHNSKINSIAIDASNQYIATCSDDSLVAINTLPDVICQRTYSHTDSSMKKVAFSCKTEYLAVSCQQPKLQLSNNKGQQVKVVYQQPCIDFYNIKKGGHAHRIKTGNNIQVLQWHPKKNILVYFDFDEQDRKRPGNQKQQRYLHIFGL